MNDLASLLYHQRVFDGLGPDGWRLDLLSKYANRDTAEPIMKFVITPVLVRDAFDGFLTLEYLDPGWEHVLVTQVRPLAVLSWDRDAGSLLEGQRHDEDWWRFSTLSLSPAHVAAIRATVEANSGSLAR